MAVKLRKPIDVPAENGTNGAAPEPIPLKPMAISGVVISRESLIDALRPYIPNIVQIEVVDDGERFLLSIGPGPEGAGPGSPTT